MAEKKKFKKKNRNAGKNQKFEEKKNTWREKIK